MNRSLVTGLAAFVLLMTGLAVMMLNSEETASDREQLFPDNDLGDATEVVVRTSTQLMTLSKVEDHWVMVEKHGYPVSMEKLSELVRQIGSAELAERKTSKPANFPRMGVQSIAEPESEGVQIDITSAGGKAYSVIVGNRASGRDGSYVRRPSENQVWLVDKNIRPDREAKEWLEPIIIDVEAESVASVTLEQGDQALLFERDDSDDLKFLGLPEGRKLKYPSIEEEPSRALVKVRLEDVDQHDPERWKQFSNAVFVLKNETRIEANAFVSEDEDYWLHFQVTPSADDDADYGDIASWDYKVASYVHDDFTKSLDDMLEAEAEAEAQESEEEALVEEQTSE